MWKNKTISLVITTILIVSTLSLITIDKAEGTNGTILYVGGNGASNYTYIQVAIDDANPGDTVFVYAGVYYESLLIDKSINLIGEDKKDTIIDANGLDGVEISADWVTLSCFTIQNGLNKNGIVLSEYSSNNTIIDNIITNSNHGIDLDSSNNNNLISDNAITNNNYYGIHLSHSSNNIIMDNTITENSNDGISLGFSDNNNIISGNTIISNRGGIDFYNSDNNIITDNTITKSEYYGTVLSEFSSNNLISNNTITNNDYTGIRIRRMSYNNTVVDNTISENSYNGMAIYDSQENAISGNTITLNKNNGIYLEFASNNKIYHNNFMDNKIHANTKHGQDTVWDNGHPSGGNYWDDYTGIDANGDSIGDTPYYIPGGEYRDRYPLMTPYNLTINQPPTAHFTYSIDRLIITFTDASNDSDGSITAWYWDFGDQTSSVISSPTHEYGEEGDYTVKLTVTDNAGGTDSYTQVITVENEEEDGVNDGGGTPGFEIVLLLIAFISLFMIVRKKR